MAKIIFFKEELQIGEFESYIFWSKFRIFGTALERFRQCFFFNFLSSANHGGWNFYSNFVKVNLFFFCGLLFLVGLDSQTEIALKSWDKLLYDDKPIGFANGGYSKGESGTSRLIRTASKSVQTHGCKTSGRISDFYTYLAEEVGFLNVPFISFRGNRFNVLFYNGEILYYLLDYLQHFLIL